MDSHCSVAGTHCSCKRDVPKLKTKGPILDAALHLFARRGFKDTSVQDIAMRANVDEASIVRNLGDKQRLYAHVVELAGDRFLRPMCAHSASNSARLAERFQQWVLALAQGGDVSALISAGSLAHEGSSPGAVVESLNRRLVDFWQRQLDSVVDPLETRRPRGLQLAQLIVLVAPVFAMGTKVKASKQATSALTADFAATIERMAANRDATTTHGAIPVRGVICRATPSPLRQSENDELVCLSHRELEVLFAVEGGESNKGVARELNVTEDTVKYHLKRIYRKLRVQRRTEALKAARGRGLI